MGGISNEVNFNYPCENNNTTCLFHNLIINYIFTSSSMESISTEFNSLYFVFVSLLKFLIPFSIVRECIRISSSKGLIWTELLSFNSVYSSLQIFQQVFSDMLAIRCLYSRRLVTKINSEISLFETHCVTRQVHTV